MGLGVWLCNLEKFFLMGHGRTDGMSLGMFGNRLKTRPGRFFFLKEGGVLDGV